MRYSFLGAFKRALFRLLYFRGMPFSILASIGFVSRYTYQEMQIILKKWNHTAEFTETNIIAKWECIHTIIYIRYNFKGEFLYIEKEVWKYM
jgi:hypothetical protein